MFILMFIILLIFSIFSFINSSSFFLQGKNRQDYSGATKSTTDEHTYLCTYKKYMYNLQKYLNFRSSTIIGVNI